jgi:high-affinity nickel-transport protein
MSLRTPASTHGEGAWGRPETVRTAVLLAVIGAVHLVAWGVLLLVVPMQLSVGDRAFGFGLGLTAYLLGVRHAFDADHIAAIDNTTRKLMADGKRPVSVGFWFALGHSTMVVLLAALVASGAKLAGTLVDDGSDTNQVLGLIGTSISGSFLFLIGAVNLVALVAIAKVCRSMRAGRYDESSLDAALASRGLVARVLTRTTRSLTRPGQMYAVGMLFGLGFDTASEVTLLVLAGSGALAGLPWYAVMVLPLLFAAGMTLFDTLDGTFMNFAYQWAFSNPVRKVYYNLTVTGLSVAVALVIGTIELLSVLHAKAGLHDPVTGWVAALELDKVGYLVVALFVVVWVLAVGYWRLARVEERWAPDRP